MLSIGVLVWAEIAVVSRCWILVRKLGGGGMLEVLGNGR